MSTPNERRKSVVDYDAHNTIGPPAPSQMAQFIIQKDVKM